VNSGMLGAFEAPDGAALSRAAWALLVREPLAALELAVRERECQSRPTRKARSGLAPLAAAARDGRAGSLPEVLRSGLRN
jgi:hypothetical protein